MSRGVAAMSVSTSPKSLVPRQETTRRFEALKRQISSTRNEEKT